jgi:hypothetical protein
MSHSMDTFRKFGLPLQPPSANHIALCRFVTNYCRRKLFIRIFLNQKTWIVHVTVAQKLPDWTLVTDESSETRLFAEEKF